MASVFFRGPKKAPRWYARIKLANGKWASRRVRQATKADAYRIAVVLEAKEERIGLGIDEPTSPPIGAALDRWSMSITNVAADCSVGRVRNHLLPAWGERTISALTPEEILKWAEEWIAEKKSVPLLHHCLTDLQRFFNWLKTSGRLPLDKPNPLDGLRARLSLKAPQPRRDRPIITTTEMAMAVEAQLPAPADLMFRVGYDTGLESGQILGLRIADTEFLGAGFIRPRFCYGRTIVRRARLPEPPVPVATARGLREQAEVRLAEGARREDRLFVDAEGAPINDKGWIQYRWDAVRKTLRLDGMTWHDATTVSFISRCIKAGEPIHVLAKWTGATQASIAKGYGHLVPDYIPRRAA